MPQRILLHDLGTEVGDWKVTFDVGWMKSGRHAYDFITGSDQRTLDARASPIGTSGWSQAQADCLKVAGSPLSSTRTADSQPVTPDPLDAGQRTSRSTSPTGCLARTRSGGTPMTWTT